MNSKSMQLNINDYYDEIPFEGTALGSIQQTLIDQGEALLLLGNNFNELEFHKALSYMYQCKGHIIISGMGKSGLIGRKICATLASTGTPSFFVHPAEAFHGDLGMITKDDVVILISNSGETNEVLQLIPSLKSFGNLIISICNNMESTMAKNSNAVLELLMDKETGPNNLAPTTSTTLTLAVGDALAVALMYKRGFAPNDFAKYHPGGSLGHRLLTRVKDVMHTSNLPFIDENNSLRQVLFTMTKCRYGLAIVLDDETKELKGLITDGDIRRALSDGDVISAIDIKAKDIMTTNPLIVDESVMFSEAEETMKKSHIKAVLVKDNSNNVVGLVEIFD